MLCLFACVVVSTLAVGYGLHLRRQLWQATESIRFSRDVQNAVKWGNLANDLGLFDIYDRIVDHSANGDFDLDYLPLRITIVAAWTHWTRARIEHGNEWQNTYEFHKPMLWLNTACELVSLPAAFWLVAGFLRKRWQCQWSDGKLLATGLFAAMLLWFNPAVIMESHCWPQWDVWIVPFFLWALWAMLYGKPIAAGLLIGYSAMGKGQALMVVPVLVLWPLFAGRSREVWGVIAGLVGGALLGALPFMLKQATAWIWLAGVMLAVAITPLLVRARQHPSVRSSFRTVLGLLIGAVAVLAVCWPLWSQPFSVTAVWLTIALGVAAGAAVVFLPLRYAPLMAVTVFALAVMVSIPLFGSSLAWFKVGLLYPTYHYNNAMTMGPAANLPAILSQRYGWRIDHPVLVLGSLTLTVRAVLRIVYVVMLVPLAAAAARHARACDVRFFFAVMTPWVLMFAILPQMHERYLLWAAACSVVFVAAGLGGLLLHLFITVYAWAMVGAGMLNVADAPAPGWSHILKGLTPDAAWALLAVTAALLYLSLTASRQNPIPDSPGSGTAGHRKPSDESGPARRHGGAGAQIS